MIPDKLAEYIAAVGITLSVLFWLNVFIYGFFAAPPNEKEKDDKII